MKKINKLLLTFAVIFGLCLLTGCSDKSKKEATYPDTIAGNLCTAFLNQSENETDLKVITEKIPEDVGLPIAFETAQINDGEYLAGFDSEIKGFKKCYTIRPMVSSIPFVAYSFEVDNPDEFVETLKAHADLRWNICTQADHLEIAMKDHFVFFVMAPESF